MKKDISVLKTLNVLIVEDDEIVLNELFATTSILFKEVFTARNGQDGYLIFEFNKIDIILTDIKMPILDGIGFVNKIREKNSECPIIVLSSYSEQSTLLKMLNLGVDGYLIKPIEFYELVETLLRASRLYSNKTARLIYFNNNKLFNTATKELFCNGQYIELGSKELLLLELFINNQNKTLSKNDIISTLWPLDEITDSALKGVLNRLRKKIGEEHIINVKGFGWKFSID
ncbi:MAG: response regulator transcription factor [Campylobacterota bacterium]